MAAADPTPTGPALNAMTERLRKAIRVYVAAERRWSRRLMQYSDDRHPSVQDAERRSDEAETEVDAALAAILARLAEPHTDAGVKLGDGRLRDAVQAVVSCSMVRSALDARDPRRDHVSQVGVGMELLRALAAALAQAGQDAEAKNRRTTDLDLRLAFQSGALWAVSHPGARGVEMTSASHTYATRTTTGAPHG